MSVVFINNKKIELSANNQRLFSAMSKACRCCENILTLSPISIVGLCAFLQCELRRNPIVVKNYQTQFK